MSGLLSAGRPAAPKKELSNALLQAAEDKVESQLQGETRANYTKIVVAGQHVALQGGPNGILASLKDSQDPIADCAKGAVALVMILRKQAKGVMPLKAMIPAAMTLLLKALDFADRSGIAKVGQPELVRATHIFTDDLFKSLGITKEMLAKAGERVQALTRDPSAMQAIRAKAGTTTEAPIA